MSRLESKAGSKSGSSSRDTGTFYAQKSARLSEEIAQLIPGGVDSPFRSFIEVGGHTIFFERASGSKLFDIDGNEYIDYLGAWGPAILGHCPAQVVNACKQAIEKAPVFGAPHRLELELASLLQKTMPAMEMVRFVNSGTEAVMSAVRLARGFKKRELIIMFEGCYHGHSDSVLASRNHSASAGIPENSKQNTLTVPYNDIEALRECLTEYGKEVAAVLIEPVAGSMGVIAPQPGYLKAVEILCKQFDALLIFDEVLTGLRVAKGGAQELFDIKPDLTCLGKALGGGMAIGAYGGKKEIMQELQPLGSVYQAGTFSGNPITMAGGVATLKLLQNPAVYETLEARSAQLFEGLGSFCKSNELPIQLQRVGSMISILFSKAPVFNYKDSLQIDAKTFALFYHQLLKRGIYFPPSSVDAAAVSASHSEEDIETSIAGICDALALTFKI